MAGEEQKYNIDVRGGVVTCICGQKFGGKTMKIDYWNHLGGLVEGVNL